VTNENRWSYFKSPVLETHSFCGVKSPCVWEGDVASSSTIDLAGGFMITGDCGRKNSVSTLVYDVFRLKLDPD
jgi:hypothetical protein